MMHADCQKMSLPLVTPAPLWQKSGRFDALGSELFRLKDRQDKLGVLSPTHEESITAMVADVAISYRQLPLKLYQIGNKFRDEMYPSYGLLRGREFIMKDLYTFDQDRASAMDTYQEISDAYQAFFTELGVPFKRVEADSGAMGGSISHEFHFLADVGEDTIKVCPQCQKGFNQEVVTDAKCQDCSVNTLDSAKSIEVGHTFLLGDRYSKVLNATFRAENGKPSVPEMGCFGLGVSRILAASVEVLSLEREIRWPPLIAPYSVAILAPKRGSKEHTKGMSEAVDLYDHLDAELFLNDVIMDDRDNITVGKKLREAKKVGYSFLILFGKECTNDPCVVEVYDVMSGVMEKMAVNDVRDYLSNKSQVVKQK